MFASLAEAGEKASEVDTEDEWMVEAVEAFGLETGVGIVVETLEALVVEM